MLVEKTLYDNLPINFPFKTTDSSLIIKATKIWTALNLFYTHVKFGLNISNNMESLELRIINHRRPAVNTSLLENFPEIQFTDFKFKVAFTLL